MRFLIIWVYELGCRILKYRVLLHRPMRIGDDSGWSKKVYSSGTCRVSLCSIQEMNETDAVKNEKSDRC